MERCDAEKVELNRVVDQQSGNVTVSPPGRMGNLDMLRSLAMLLVVVLHYLGKGNLLGEITQESLSTTQTVAWFLEALSIVAVNVYMLISGYFVSKSSFKVSRVIGLWIQLEFYSVGIGLLSILMGWTPMAEVDTYFLLGLLFPVSMGHYWFMTAYIYLYLLFALLAPVLKKLGKNQFQVILGLLFLVFCVVKSVVPVRFELDEMGYDCLWYLCMFLLGAYIRRFGFPVLRRKRSCLLLYLVSASGIFAVTMVLRMLYLQSGSFSYIIRYTYEYNHILNVLAALGLFGVFLYLRLPEGLSGFFGRIAPYTLGVYLLHENQGVRYAWQSWLGADRIQSVLGLILGVLFAAVIVFVAGILVDWCRAKVTKLSDKLLMHVKPYSKLRNWISRLDECFKS